MKKFFSDEIVIKDLFAGTGVGYCFFHGRANHFPSVVFWGTEQAQAEEIQEREEMFYRKIGSLKIVYDICPRRCQVGESERGYCGNKENRGGKYYSLVYNKVCATHLTRLKKTFFPLFPRFARFFSCRRQNIPAIAYIYSELTIFYTSM
jgi:hypothetical protein